MSIYAIGDVQGCLTPLKALLKTVAFDSAHDQLWFCGDLVNRGPQSLEVLRFVRTLPAVVVLGNHDLHLLAIAYGKQGLRRGDTLAPILAASDREELLAWLRTRPLFHHDPQLRWSLVHAGIPPQWSVAQAQAHAAEVECVLREPGFSSFLGLMYGDQPDLWENTLSGIARLRAIVNACTRL